jgi:hypothetical protein
MPQGGGFTSVNMTGWAAFRDITGRVTSNHSYVNVTVLVRIYPNQPAFQIAYPTINVQLYRDGESIGSASLTGSVNINGLPSSGNLVYLTGDGSMNGGIYVEDYYDKAALRDPAPGQNAITVLKEMHLLDLLAERNATAKVVTLGEASFRASVLLDNNWDVYFQLKQEGVCADPGVWKEETLKNGVSFNYAGGELKIKEEAGEIILTDAKGNSAKTSSGELFDLLYAGSSLITFDERVSYAVIRNLEPLSGNEGTITLRKGSDGLYYYSLTPDSQVAGYPRWLLAINGVLYGLRVTDTELLFVSEPIEDLPRPLFRERRLKF